MRLYLAIQHTDPVSSMDRLPLWLLLFSLSLHLAACQSQHEAPDASPASSSSDSTAQDLALQAEGELEGRFFVSGPMGEGDLERDSTHFYVHMEGESARALYRYLPGEVTEWPCEDGHDWAKHLEAIICTANVDSTEHRCYFAIDMPKEELRRGVTC